MRTALLLSIFVFVSTLFWPQLLSKQLMLLAMIATLFILFVPQLRILAVIPITALYFTFYVNLTLTGQPYASAQTFNKQSLAIFSDGQDHTIVVKIVSLISDNNRGYFKAKLIELDGDHLNYSPLVEMRWYKPSVILQAGQLHRFVGRFKPIYGRGNPAGFDRQKWSYSEHIAYKVTIKDYLSQINDKPTIRAGFYQQIQDVTNDLKHQGLLLALSFADKSLIPYEKKLLIRNLGISHLFAISGLHIGLFFSGVYVVAQLIVNHLLAANKMGWFSLRLINIFALTGAWFYAYLAGFSLPTQRAFLMLFIVVLLFSLKRKYAKFDMFLLVLFVVLIWDPLAILSLSLWLSFTAVAIILGLLWAFPMIHHTKVEGQHSDGINTLIKYVKLLFFLQLALTILMLPVQLLSFSGVSLVGMLINLIAIPLFSLLIIPAVLLASLVTLFSSSLGQWIFNQCDQLLSLFFIITDVFNGSYHQFSVVDEKLLSLLCVLLIVLLIMHFQSIQQRKISYLFSFTFICLLIIPRFQVKQEWFVEVIDVGQGLAVLVRNDNNVMLYDTGARYPSGFNMVDSEITPYLIALGINKIDNLVISHSDIDHAGGADIIAEQFMIDKRWAGEPLKSEYTYTQCKQGDRWQLGELDVEVLSPVILTKHNNNNSCVLRITDGFTSLLLTGDIEKKQEEILIKQLGERLSSDILLAPHHGSRYSSTETFIRSVNPQWVAFSAGFMNQWQFPAKEVIKRYQKQAVKTVNSGVSGLIRFKITPQAINMETFREDLAPYWYHHSLSFAPSIGNIDDKN